MTDSVSTSRQVDEPPQIVPGPRTVRAFHQVLANTAG